MRSNRQDASPPPATLVFSPLKGRGTAWAIEHRFSRESHESFDDGWGTLEQAAHEETMAPGTTLIEERVKSILSSNDSPDIGFSQSINPYRGCEHGCIYCIHGDTPLLMADGSARRIADVRPGDVLYGTARQGWYRRYVKSRVLAHWSVIKPAYRVTLEDGTTLVTGPDHRFLTERGWKFVTGTGYGPDCRPHLTLNNKLIGTGAFAQAIAKNGDYRLGYLCGVIRGDGLLASHQYRRSTGARADQHQFRLALCDVEGLLRTQSD